MTRDKIINDLKKGNFRPVYWLEGDEEFFIDEIIQFAENSILTEAEAGFNLTVLYGRDSSWSDVVNACRRYPMFSERQVVILKEAQGLAQIERLEGYVDKPLGSTILFIAYKNKKVDKRTKLASMLKKKAVLLTTKKLYDRELPEWITSLAASRGYRLTVRARDLLVDHIGNDLSRLNNEIGKLALNMGERDMITEDDIENYIGISKDFNVFELQHAIASRDMYRAVRIIRYFESNPKAAPIQLVIPALYSHFSKAMMVYSLASRTDQEIAAATGINPFVLKDYRKTAVSFSYDELERNILLLNEYNLRSIGIHDAGTGDAGLLKELVAKMIPS